MLLEMVLLTDIAELWFFSPSKFQIFQITVLTENNSVNSFRVFSCPEADLRPHQPSKIALKRR